LEENDFKLDINCTYLKNDAGEKEYHERMINILIIQYVDELTKEGCEIGYANMKTKDFIG
jgi:hypothetical protein